MNLYESVVLDYLRADRALFVNAQSCIQLNPADNPDTSGLHWYCDAVACDFRNKMIFLCEITYSNSLHSLVKRLGEWKKDWPLLQMAIHRDCFLPTDWSVRP